MNTRLFDMQADFTLIPDAPETVRELGGLWRLADLLPSSERSLGDLPEGDVPTCQKCYRRLSASDMGSK